ncbi:MAG: tRNA lysidine(34) synthetase TilS [Alphaproteobacteria bacterium]|nr:tRNA lysidine(34) synthetase TilS [Alphaproteobacteria bacterium]
MMNKNFVDFMQKYTGQKMAVAVSGGVDSVALLYWLVKIRADIVCLHVNHGLRIAADTEAKYVQDLCEQLNVPCHIFKWTDEKPKTGIEDAARMARYKMMTDFCHKNGIEIILTAHQADDQIETFLMNLGRGSGVYGLAAMRGETLVDGIKIVRPLLGVFRRELQEYCDKNSIKYFSDEMNFDPHYTRVKIRQNRHLMESELGISDSRILLAIQNLGRVRDAVEDFVGTAIANVMYDGYAKFSESFLFDLAPDIRLKFLGGVIQRVGGDRYQPRLNSLIDALDKLTADVKFTLGHCTLRRFNNQILIVPEGTNVSFRKRNEKTKKYHKSNKSKSKA